MTKYTGTSLYRHFEEKTIKPATKTEMAVIRTVRREKPIEAQEREERNCKACGFPMLVAPGQLAFFHKDCRQMRSYKGRKRVMKKRGILSIFNR